MKILVFVSKHTGLALLETLYSISDNYLFVVGPKNRKIIEESLESRGMQYLKLEDFRSHDFQTESFDWLLNLWGSHIFSSSELQLARNSLNIHPSYLPFSKGSDPVFWSQFNSLPQGVTLHAITQQLDSGPIFVRKIIETPLIYTGKECYEKVVDSCIALFAEAWPDIRSGTIKSFNPDEADVSKPNKRSEMLLQQSREFDDFDKSQKELINWLLAYNYGPDFLPVIRIQGVDYSLELTVRKNFNQ